jgi:hypothetical protein
VLDHPLGEDEATKHDNKSREHDAAVHVASSEDGQRHQSGDGEEQARGEAGDLVAEVLAELRRIGERSLRRRTGANNINVVVSRMERARCFMGDPPGRAG